MLNPIRIAVLVSGGGTNLQALMDAQQNGLIRSGKIVLVVSNKKDAYALERARLAGIPAQAITKKAAGGQEGFEKQLTELLDREKIDLIVLAGFLQVLTGEFTRHYPDRIINIHPSLIPSFCGDGFYGLKVHEAALAKGVKVSGATVHFVNEITDGGRIIAQKAVEVQEGDTPEVLQRRIMEQAEWIILPQAAEKVCSEIIKGEEQ